MTMRKSVSNRSKVPGTTTFYAKHIPRALWVRFCAWCKLRGIHYRVQIEKMLREAVLDTNNPRPIEKRAYTVINRKDRTNKNLDIKNMPIALVRHFQAWCQLRDIPVYEKLTSMIEILLQKTEEEDNDDG